MSRLDLGTHKLEYTLGGNIKGPKVLFLHGLGMSCTQFDRELSSLAADYHVAAISLRGQGNSSRPHTNKANDLSIPNLAADVLAWMDVHGWVSTNLVGCSMGGVVALELLTQHGQRFDSLATFGTTPKLSAPQLAVNSGSWLLDWVLPGLIPERLASTLAKTTAPNKAGRELLQADFLRAFRGWRKSLYHLRCALANYDYTGIMQEAEIPLLLLQGEKDHAVNKEIKKVWPEISNKPLVRKITVADAGHVINYDQPIVFEREIREFLEGARSW